MISLSYLSKLIENQKQGYTKLSYDNQTNTAKQTNKTKTIMGILYTQDQVQCFIHESTEKNKSHVIKRPGKEIMNNISFLVLKIILR